MRQDRDSGLAVHAPVEAEAGYVMTGKAPCREIGGGKEGGGGKSPPGRRRVAKAGI